MAAWKKSKQETLPFFKTTRQSQKQLEEIVCKLEELTHSLLKPPEPKEKMAAKLKRLSSCRWWRKEGKRQKNWRSSNKEWTKREKKKFWTRCKNIAIVLGINSFVTSLITAWAIFLGMYYSPVSGQNLHEIVAELKRELDI
uniref:Uncharacterized protein n=1 Tax=Plectus sambesii TaxID=2011161 RepID=A0A914V9F4_9BILA